MQSLVEAGWLDLISGYLIKSSLILILAVVLAFMLRKRSAGLRHLVLSLFLIGLLFLPVLSSLTTGWETGLLPSWQAGSSVHSGGTSGIGDQDASLRTLETDPDESGVFAGSEAAGRAHRPFPGGFLSRMKPVLGLGALAAWLVGLALLLFRLALGLFGAVRLTHEGRSMEDSIWKRLLYRFLASVSLRRKVNLLSHDRVRVPLTWGFLKPVVMMPAGSIVWSESQRSSALYHELAHVKRGDFLVMLLARLSRALYWFNPLSWLVFRMIKNEQEKACDELVLKAGIKPSTYAENLLFIRNSVPVHWNPPAAVLGAMGRSNLNDRLVAILKQKLKFEEVKMKTKIMLGVLVVLSVSVIGMARPSSSGASTAEAVIDEATIAPALMDFLETGAIQKEQEKAQQKKEEKQKQEKQEEKKAKEEKEATTLVWTAKKGEKGAIVITIDQKGEKKTIQLTAPYVLTIKEGPDKTILVTSPHLELKKGEEGTWTLKSDKLHVSGDVHTIKLDEGAVIHVKKHGEKGVEIIELTAPAIKLTKYVHLPKDINVHVVTKEGDTKKVIVSPHVEVHPEVQVHTNVKVHTDVDAHADVAVAIRSEISKKQLEEIRESIKKLKEQDLDATEKKQELERIEKVIAKMNERLEERSKSEHAFSYRIHTAPVHVEVRHKESGEANKDVYVVLEKENHVVGLLDDEGTFSIYFRGELGEEHKDAFEKVVKRLKEDLPEGYEVTTDYDEDKDSFSIKITGGEEIDETSDLVKKLIKVLKEELDKIKK